MENIQYEDLHIVPSGNIRIATGKIILTVGTNSWRIHEYDFGFEWITCIELVHIPAVDQSFNNYIIDANDKYKIKRMSYLGIEDSGAVAHESQDVMYFLAIGR